jgi:hypothetical protein
MTTTDEKRERLRLVVDNTHPEIIVGPTLIGGLGGDVVRLIKRPVSGGKFEFVVEWWPRPGAGWVEAPEGAFKPSEVFMGEDEDGWTPPMPVSSARAAGLGIPVSDLAPGTWERR